MHRRSKGWLQHRTYRFPSKPFRQAMRPPVCLRWGYRRYRDMFNDRQLFGLGTLFARIQALSDQASREALLTVFSDALRYQNMLCRYDTYALKCQDVFSVHGFPVGLVQCENNLLGIPGVGSGGFSHFVEKYRRAKAYCREPFESRGSGSRRRRLVISGEEINARPVDHYPSGETREAWLSAASATEIEILPNSLDGVFTDPPYFANVQYAELMDFCYVWLRQGLKRDLVQFGAETTRSPRELTGNVTMGRDLAHFAEGLSRVYRHYAAGAQGGGAVCLHLPPQRTGRLRAARRGGARCGPGLHGRASGPGRMGASLHINGTASSTLDSVFVCRRTVELSVSNPRQRSCRCCW